MSHCEVEDLISNHGQGQEGLADTGALVGLRDIESVWIRKHRWPEPPDGKMCVSWC